LHSRPQVLDEQVGVLSEPKGQVDPQAPQLFGSAVRNDSHPFAGLPSQFSKPGLHMMPQVPDEQVGVPFAEEHTWPHVPQLFTSAKRFTQFPEQVVLPGGHEAVVVSIG
jgi:hypothetical protein